MKGSDAAAVALPGALVLAPAVLAGEPIAASHLMVTLAAGIAVAAGALGAWAGGGGRAARVAGLAAFGVACFLLPWASYAGAGLVVAGLLGLGAGAGAHLEHDRRAVVVPLMTAALLVLIRVTAGVEWSCAAGGAVALAAVPGAFRGRQSPVWWRRQGFLVALLGAGGAFGVFWVGSTSPSLTWFGSLTFHGPRSSTEVAITFDDGPNGDYTTTIERVLLDHGVRGTFFLVGKAVVQDPTTARRLVADGNVVGNHSQNHGAFSYLDPRYPELDEAQRSIGGNVGVCPALFRPPHGTHTPFMSAAVDDRGMTLVTWDVSARDWVETDAERLARSILAKVRPGSIILLHDGIDGNIPADRSVVVAALPLILDGLKAKGLQPVTLDRLLGVPAYLPLDRC